MDMIFDPGENVSTQPQHPRTVQTVQQRGLCNQGMDDMHIPLHSRVSDAYNNFLFPTYLTFPPLIARVGRSARGEKWS